MGHWRCLPAEGLGRYCLRPLSRACRAHAASAALPFPPAPPGPPSLPSAPGPRARADFLRELGEEVEAKDAELSPTSEQHEQKAWLVGRLQPLLEKQTGGRLHLFGSCENGFWMQGSDIDACLVLKRCTLKKSWLTKLRLVQSLVAQKRLGKAQLIGGARVPVAKLSDADGIELCDISVNNVAALENSTFVGMFAQLDGRVPRLGRIIKHWASRRQINNRSEGTLSTYTLILQLFFFLQTRQPPVLPFVLDLLSPELQHSARQLATSGLPRGMEARAVNVLLSDPEMDASTGELRSLPFLAEGLKGFARENSESLTELLLGFFELWGKPEFRGGEEGEGQTVLVFDGTRETNDLGVLVMRCPLTGKNVNPFTTSVWRAIHAEFERAALLLAAGSSLEQLCEAAECSPAGRPRRERA